ncbi:MAG TPA: VWA domain-containing protein [Vicinamibacterales bacterium]|jgi:Mg-chelatase subunit ChlD|nr:VWA domain-containing protein [Vicinamibacterales bacterium]
MSAVALLALLALPAAQAATRPANVVLIVDVSHSVTYGIVKRDRTLVVDAASALAAAMQAGDTARVGTFGDEITIEPAPLKDADAVRAAGARLAERIGGRSPIWDALVAAAGTLEGAGAPRGIIVLTDGRSTGNRIGFADAVDQLKRAGIPVFVVSLDKSDRPIPDPGARLEQLAAATGGTCLFVDRPALPAAIKRSVSSLRQVSATAQPRRNNY